MRSHLLTWGFFMNKNTYHCRSLFFLTILLPILVVNICPAQQVTEPQIPIYIMYPKGQDSLKNIDRNILVANNAAISVALQKCDTLQIQIHKAAAETSEQFTWLYCFIAVLGIINIFLLFFISRIRKDLAQMKRSK